jgi:mannose-6-phosphate isomerase-like protein (cupin superfamily)
MTNFAKFVLPRQSLIAPGAEVRGKTLSIGNWPASGDAHEVAPLHVHFEDDEAWYVISGAIRFRFQDSAMIAEAGSTVLVPAGVAHTFGNAGPEPSRFILIAPSVLDELIQQLHSSEASQHAEIYRRHASELLE